MNVNFQWKHSSAWMVVAFNVKDGVNVGLLVSKVKTVNDHRPQKWLWGTCLCTEALGRPPVNTNPLQNDL